MTHEDWAHQGWEDLNATAEGDLRRSDRWGSLNVWQRAGVFLLSALVSQVIVSKTSRDCTESLVATMLSMPLLAWLLIPLRRSDDLFDEANRRRAELIDTLAVVLIWTWPWTCCAPLAAVAHSILLLIPGRS